MELAGSIAWIAGGASGLGAATAREFAEAGARAVILDRNAPAGASLAAELCEGARFIPADLTDPASAEAAAQATHATFNGVHVLVNCAGIATAQRVLGKDGLMPLNDFTRVIDINLTATFNLIRLALPHLFANEPSADGERGIIINTASIAAYDGQIGQAAYAASKAAVAGLTLPLAREFARQGVRVIAIAPGPFETPLLAGLPEAARQSLAAAIPFPQRLGQPPEFARLVRFIVENAYLNGEVIRLDGALRMGPK